MSTYEIRLIKLLSVLLSYGGDINVRESGDNSTYLHLAVWENLLEVCKFLIDNGIDLLAVNNEGNTALHIAVINYHKNHIKGYKIISYILNTLKQSGYVQQLLSARNDLGDTVLEIAECCGYFEIVELISNMFPTFGNRKFIESSKFTSYSMIWDYIQNTTPGELCNPDSSGVTLLMVLIGRTKCPNDSDSKTKMDCVKFLLEKIKNKSQLQFKKYLEKKDHYHKSLIQYAILDHNNYEIINYLITIGFKISNKDLADTIRYIYDKLNSDNSDLEFDNLLKILTLLLDQ
jgi:ankyrin repeat protein